MMQMYIFRQKDYFASLYLSSLCILSSIYCILSTSAINSMRFLLLLFLPVIQTFTGSYVKKSTLIIGLCVVHVNMNCPHVMRSHVLDLEQRLQVFNS